VIRVASPSLSLEQNVESELVELASLRPGEVGIVARVEADLAIGRRLLDLGFVPETPVRVVRRAPLGDPVSYELRGYRICLRRRDAAHVLVRRAEPASPALEAGRR
jgi:Fe2+ transport system protein FeoA